MDRAELQAQTDRDLEACRLLTKAAKEFARRNGESPPSTTLPDPTADRYRLDFDGLQYRADAAAARRTHLERRLPILARTAERKKAARRDAELGLRRFLPSARKAWEEREAKRLEAEQAAQDHARREYERKRHKGEQEMKRRNGEPTDPTTVVKVGRKLY